MMKVQFPQTTAAIEVAKTSLFLKTLKWLNALYCIAGCACRTLHDHLKTSSVEGKELLVLYLSDINGSDKNGEEWINAINHGCLWQVNEVFQTFLTME